MIEVRNLTKNYGAVAAVKDVSFDVAKGDILGFLGPNGAGKTTTMRILTGYFPATKGTAKVAGYDVFTQLNEVRKRIGYLPESVPLYTDMPVHSYLEFAAQMKGLSGRDRKKAVEKVMDDVSLTHMKNRIIKKLSKGYRQRVGLAQALVNNPEVLVLDEPTIGLDPKQITEIRALIKHLAGDRTVILSTHILPEVSITCDRVTIINQGRIVVSDTLENLTKSSDGRAEVSIAVRGTAADPAAVLRKVSGVEKIDVVSQGVEDGVKQLNLSLPSDRDVRGEVAKAITESGLDLLEMNARRLTLEDVFIRVITSEDQSRETAGTDSPEDLEPETKMQEETAE